MSRKLKMDDLPKVFGNYEYLRDLTGDTGHSRIIIAKDKRKGVEVACKIFSRDPDKFLAVEEEIRIHQTLVHPNIVPIIDVVYEKRVIILVMEYFPNGDLFQFIHSQVLSMEERLKIFMKIIDAVAYIHSHGIAHLDLKPENIFLRQDLTPMIADFGCCETPVTRKINPNYNGTYYYCSPEFLDGTQFDNRPADVWALGIILYVIFAHHYPWREDDVVDVKTQIKQGDLGDLTFLPVVVVQLIKECCNIDPNSRITANKLVFKLHTHFFKEANKGIKATINMIGSAREQHYEARNTSRIISNVPRKKIRSMQYKVPIIK